MGLVMITTSFCAGGGAGDEAGDVRTCGLVTQTLLGYWLSLNLAILLQQNMAGGFWWWSIQLGRQFSGFGILNST